LPRENLREVPEGEKRIFKKGVTEGACSLRGLTQKEKKRDLEVGGGKAGSCRKTDITRHRKTTERMKKHRGASTR